MMIFPEAGKILSCFKQNEGGHQQLSGENLL
jgi:hypothetical protein